MINNIEIRVAALAIAQGIGIGHQVAKGAVRLDQLLHASGLADLILFGEMEINAPTNWLIRNAQGREDLVVEVVATQD